MRLNNQTEKIAMSQLFPKSKAKGYQLVLNGKVVFENNSVALCQTFKTVNALNKAILKAVY